MRMSNMSDTKRNTQRWRHAALNHMSPFSPFFLLASALLRSPNGHEATEMGSSATGQLQSCKSCFVIFHLCKPGSRPQTLGSQGNPRAVLGGARAVAPLAWIQACLRKSPSGNGICLPSEVLLPQQRDKLHRKVRAHSLAPFKTPI